MALSIKPEDLANVSEVQITNSLISGIIITLIIIFFYIFYEKKISIIPTRNQLIVEYIVEALYELCKNILGDLSNKIFPLIFTFFIFIISSNWFGLLPITGSIGWAKKGYEDGSLSPMNLAIKISENIDFKFGNYEIIPFFRSPSADLNFTIALAIISFLVIQYLSLKYLGINYLGKYFDYRVKVLKGWKVLLTPLLFILNFFWKTLELILEISKIISFSFRLFGNIFAGEVLLAVITLLTLGLLTFPFLGFEIFIGFIQAIVFIFLTMVFIKVNLDSHH